MNKIKEISTLYFSSPIGPIEISANENGITSVYFKEKTEKTTDNNNKHLNNCSHQLEEYFNHKRKNFDLDICLNGTDFRINIWNKLKNVPYGETRTYKEIAKAAGNEKGSRAIGGACNKNPLTIIVPCHRIIASNGSLTGYAGGLDKKSWLLNHEQNI